MQHARLRLGQRLLRSRLGPAIGRMSRYAVFAQQMKSASGGPLPDRDIALMWAAMQYGGGRAIQHRLVRYIDDRVRFEQARWLPALAATTTAIHLCWGALDRVAPPAIAEHLKAHVCPNARLTLLPRAGHFCQQEDAEAWNEAVLRFFDRD
jgi:pimeloyl-ACP methyl ester carboxylesterase